MCPEARADGSGDEMYTTLWWIIGGATILAGVYGLHRLALQLEKRGLIDYMEKRPPSRGGAMFSPFQEMVQPEIRHVIEAQDERRYKREDAGEPPGPDAAPAKQNGEQ